jgi:C-terminal processing protease CtpA/Prc
VAQLSVNAPPASTLSAILWGLPNRALFMFPVEQSITGNGTVLEGHGVIPDIKVALDCNQLLQGIDTQLMAAIRHLKSEKGVE